VYVRAELTCYDGVRWRNSDALAVCATYGGPMRPDIPATDSQVLANHFDVAIRREDSSDISAVREVHSAAFEGHEQVVDLVDALRSAPGAFDCVSAVACVGEQVVGHVMLSPCRLDAPRRIVDVFALSPIGVQPEYQGRGIGTDLIAYALAAADSMQIPLIFLEGDPDYYGGRGFERADRIGFRSPSLRIPDESFQVTTLSAYEPWMIGTFVYSETFWTLDCVGLREPAS